MISTLSTASRYLYEMKVTVRSQLRDTRRCVLIFFYRKRSNIVTFIAHAHANTRASQLPDAPNIIIMLKKMLFTRMAFLLVKAPGVHLNKIGHRDIIIAK